MTAAHQKQGRAGQVDNIPLQRRELNPLITSQGYRNLLRLLEHSQAPVWNFTTGDRLIQSDLAKVRRFENDLRHKRHHTVDGPPDSVITWLRKQRQEVPVLARKIPKHFKIRQNWAQIAFMDREDIAARIETLIPLNADLGRLIVYDTSGTTGHAMRVPHHPLAMAKVMTMLTFVLERYGIRLDLRPDVTACINVGAQVFTAVLANVFSLWHQAGFAKVNLHAAGWREKPAAAQARAFFADLAPMLITGDPVGFGEMLTWEIEARPEALVSTALSLPEGLTRKLSATYGCPVIDWYASTETGPLGYACARGAGFHVLPPDVFLEIIGTNGLPVREGEYGEITVTGGRNPYLPLVRYRTGDFGRLMYDPCPCGDPMPRIMALKGREPVLYTAADGTRVNPVDIGRVLRNSPFLRHEFIQREDGSCDLKIQPLPNTPGPDIERIGAGLKSLLGQKTRLRIRLAQNWPPDKPGQKEEPYQSEMYHPGEVSQ